MSSYNQFMLNDKLIIVTGASSGIGRQCAITCSQMGASVVICGRNKARLDESLSMMKNPGNHLSFTFDLNDYERMANVVDEVVTRKGKINGLINCAGISTTVPINVITTDRMMSFFQANVIGPMYLTINTIKARNFSDTGGSIIFISSVMGVVGESGKSIYSLTKGAIISAVKSMAVELSRKKIRCNAISPGVVMTPMSENAVYNKDANSLKKIIDLHPLGLGKPEDVANACVFLLSDASRWITGTNLIVDGGYLAR